MKISEDDDLTPEEASAFAALPRLANSDDLAERRVIHALRERGLLGASRNDRTPRGVKIGLGVAAAALLFAAGTAFGKRLAERGAGVGSPSIQVQQAGTAYVDALVRLTNARTTERTPNLVAGLEAGTATLRAAATSLAEIEPNDPTVRRIRTSLDAATGAAGEQAHAGDDRTVIWF